MIQIRPETLPEDMRFGLVASLFADAESMMMGAVVSIVSGAVITILTRNWAAGVATLAILVVTALRVALLREHARQPSVADDARIQSREKHYVLGASLYMLLLGVISFVAITQSSDPFVLILALSLSITNTVSIAVRNFAVANGIAWQLMAIMGPLAVAFLVRGGLLPYLIPLVVAPTWLFVRGSAARLRGMLLSEMAYRRHSETIAGQFDFAINNMSHGMCLVSVDQKILISNAKFAELFGLRSERLIANVGLKALMRLAVRRGLIANGDATGLLALVMAVNGEAHQRELQIETATARAYDITLTHHSSGGCVIVIQDVTEKRDAERAIDRMARFDAVTNLRNRGAFEIGLMEALAAAPVSGRRTDVLFIDLDRFKHVNDTLGHKVGDKVLVIAGDRLSALARDSDFVARWGGDEFVILRSGPAAAAGIETFAAEIIAELSRPCSIDGVEIVVGASIGIAVANGGDSSADTILQQADMALYTAKRAGRGCYRIYEEAMSTSAQERRLLELDLHAALASEAFVLYYQPIVDLETRAIVGLEALARWNHPTRGGVSPATFVPVLEELNLINAFGAWTLRRACRDAARWPANVRVSVNVSAKQLDAHVLYDAVQQALGAAGLQADRLELEITETALLRDSESAQTTLQRIHALGVRIALDDFGTGYSSLSHLMRFPLDKVKIDQSFTALSDKEDKAAILIENVARLSRQLGMVVTIEGIETDEQLERMKRLGPIAQGQGYLFSKPIPGAAVERLFDVAVARDVA
jgi:diguanylate cyclase (GGDEF)-like protein